MSTAELAIFRKHLLRVYPKPFLWALGGSLSAGTPDDVYRRMIAELQKKGTPCILDTDNESLRLGIQAKPFMIKPNEFEMQRLMGTTLKSVGGYHRAAESLVRRGVRVVVVSLGARGALFVTKTDAFHAEGPKVEVKSKVGAGDSLIGGFALGLYRGKSVREAARLGIAASTSAVMTEGTRLCRRSDVPKILPKVTLKSL